MATVKSVLNGVIGDYLEASGNELATQMAFYDSHNTRPLPLEDIANTFIASNSTSNNTTKSNRLCILLHGLVNDERSWRFPYDGRDDDDDDATVNNSTVHDGMTDYGFLLQNDFPDMAPLYLRYNTGLHISTNGRKLSLMMEALLHTIQRNSTNASSGATTTSHAVQDIIFVCHSMGGLVGRSATHHAKKHNLSWLKHVGQMVFLGTPHGGSYWEKGGNVAACAMDAIPLPYMKLAAQIGNLRSSGIKDLRYGYILDEDWMGTDDPDALLINGKKQAALVDWISYHFVTGTVTSNPNNPISLAFGDGLVTKASAEGRSHQKAHSLGFSPKEESFREFPGVNHNALQTNMEVYRHIKGWIEHSAGANSPGGNGVMVPDAHRNDTKFEQELLANNVSVSNVVAPGKWAQCRGATSLVQVAVDSGSTAVQNVQNQITDEIYGIFGKFRPIAPAVERVRLVQTRIVDVIYGSIRAVSYGSSETLKLAFEHMDSRERAK